MAGAEILSGKIRLIIRSLTLNKSSVAATLKKPIPPNGDIRQDDLLRSLASYAVTEQEKAFIDFTAKQFDPKLYLEINPDVANEGMDPLKHWFDYGLAEGRRISPLIDVCYGDLATSFYCRKWTHFLWRNKTVAVRMGAPVPQEIMKQVLNQARYDADVLAPGESAIANLRKFFAFDFASRDGLDVDGLLAAIPRSPAVVLTAERLAPGAQAEFLANLVDVLDGAGHATQVILTAQSFLNLCAMNEPSLLARLRKANILCWPDFSRDRSCATYLWDICRDASSGANLALLINGLRPKAVVVADDKMGIDMISRFGRGLSKNSALYRVRLSAGHDGNEGAQAENRVGDTLSFASLVIDCERATTMFDRLRRLLT